MKGMVSCCWDIMWLYRTEFILSFYSNFTANMFADTSPEDEKIVLKRVIPIFWHATMTEIFRIETETRGSTTYLIRQDAKIYN
jgi:hypothetical protein